MYSLYLASRVFRGRTNTGFLSQVRRWDADKSKGQSQLADLLQFVTGSRRVPVGGFSQLQGFNGGRHKFTIARGRHLSAASLLTAHACICTLDLPPYPDLETTGSKMELSLSWGTRRFDETARRPLQPDDP